MPTPSPLILLPPSEGKAPGGTGPAWSPGTMAVDLDRQRERVLRGLTGAMRQNQAARAKLLGVKGDALAAATTANREVRSAPTAPAIERYTGVLYDALDVGSLRGASAGRARERLAVGSALFGLVRADDRIPAYRLSASAKLPGRRGLSTRWRPVLEPVLEKLAAEQLIVDLRSGAYAALGRIPGAVRVQVLAEHPDGRRTVVSHFNKAHKGRLARALVETRAEPKDCGAVAAVAERAGMRVEHDGDDLTVVVPA